MSEPKHKDLNSVMEMIFTQRRYRNGLRVPKYRCIKYPECSGAHGAHPDGTPLGIPGDAKNRLLRQTLHEVFEIKYPGTILRTRKKTFIWLQGHGYPGHIGEMSSDQCREVIHTLINKNAPTADDDIIPDEL